MKLLLIEDDAQTADYVCRGLAELGHATDHAATGVDGLTAAIVGRYDAIILDRNLPGLDGLSVLKSLRAQGNRTPVLVLSALGQVDDRIARLRAGGAIIWPSRSRSASSWRGSRRSRAGVAMRILRRRFARRVR